MGVYFFIFMLLTSTEFSYGEDVPQTIQNKNVVLNGDWNILNSNSESVKSIEENYDKSKAEPLVRKIDFVNNGEFDYDSELQNEMRIDDNDFSIDGMNSNNSIIRPCTGFDLYCIRRYFARNSKCHPVEGSVPEPYYRPEANYFFPNFNLSTVQTGVYYRGFQGIVEDFYLNNQTDLAVLTTRFRNFRLNTTLDFYRYHRVGKEPAITRSVSAVIFPSLTITTTFRGIDNLDLASSDSYGFLDQQPRAVIDPIGGVHQDPVVATTFAALLAGIDIAVLEGLLTDAAFTASTFIQYSICDFGLKLI